MAAFPNLESSRVARLALPALFASLTPACGSSDADEMRETDLLIGEPSDEGDDNGSSLYALMFEVYDAEGDSNSYLATFDSLDIDAVDPTTSREYAGGRAYLQTYDGWIFVGEPSSPIVRRFSVGPGGALTEDGTISFANFGLEAGTIDPWSLAFISATKAYLFDSREGTTIVWNPTSMEITGEIPGPFLREGWSLDGSPGVLRGNRLYRSIFWANFDTAEYSSDQLLAIYDVENDALLETVPETRCPNPGNLAQQDEAGNIYFSNWIWPVSGTLMRGAAENCVLRIGADSQRFDADWTLAYSDIAEDRTGAMFTYVKDGRGLVSIFDDSQISFDATTDPWDYAGSENWTIWSVDIETRSGEPVPGIPPNSGAYTPSIIDDRTFVMVPSDNWSSSELFEIVDGVAAPSIEVPGWSYMFVKIK